MTDKWIVQGDSDGASCVPIALCNALRFWGLESPEPHTEGWELLIDIAASRHGSAIFVAETIDYLNLVRIPMGLEPRKDSKYPLLFNIHDPKEGYHAVLATERKEDSYHLVNYKGEASNWVKIKDLDFPKREDHRKFFWIVPRFHIWNSGRVA